MDWFINASSVVQALIMSLFTFFVTALGSLIVCFFKEINGKILSVILGFSGGVMLAASFWSLLAPAIEQSSKLGYITWLFPMLGFIAGGLFVLFADKFLDRIIKGKENLRTSGSLKRSILLVGAITIHNIPEGMAIGVAFGGLASGIDSITLIGAVMLAVGIGIQNFPEGAAVSLPLRKEGYSRLRSFLYGALSAIVEPVSAVIGVILVMQVRSILPFLLSFAAGAMVSVVSREILPESIGENKNLATLGLIFGFVLMMVLDVSLG